MSAPKLGFFELIFFFKNKKMLKFHVLETFRIETFLSKKSEKVEETGSSDENHYKSVQEIQQSRKW